MQAAVDGCFAGLGKTNFPPGTQIACAAVGVRAPGALQGLWRGLGGGGGGCGGAAAARPEDALPEELIERTSIVLVVCDFGDPVQAAAVRGVLEWLDSLAAWPPLAVLPLPGGGGAGCGLQRELLGREGLFNSCVDEVFPGAPCGFGLALRVRGAHARARSRREALFHDFLRRDSGAKEVQALEMSMDHTLWDYVPRRLRLAIPPVDYGLGDHDGKAVAGYALRRLVGRGSFALVHEVDPPEGTEARPGGEVVKAIPKWAIERSICDVRQLQRTWQIMQSVSTRWRHPNIARMYQIYHSPTHFYIRMEHGGSENLYRRLLGRAAGTRSLSAAQLQSLALQVGEVINHLHVGPGICHRDIKPENFGLAGGADGGDDAGELTLKLIDFDTATVQRPGALCKRKCGTFPFVAPDLAECEYDGMAADMWSTGILLLELACGTRIIESAVLGEASPPTPQEMEAREDSFPVGPVGQLREALADGALLQHILASHAVPELAAVARRYGAAVRGALRIAPPQRWTSERLVAAMRALVRSPEPLERPQGGVLGP